MVKIVSNTNEPYVNINNISSVTANSLTFSAFIFSNVMYISNVKYALFNIDVDLTNTNTVKTFINNYGTTIPSSSTPINILKQFTNVSFNGNAFSDLSGINSSSLVSTSFYKIAVMATYSNGMSAFKVLEQNTLPSLSSLITSITISNTNNKIQISGNMATFNDGQPKYKIIAISQENVTLTDAITLMDIYSNDILNGNIYSQNSTFTNFTIPTVLLSNNDGSYDIVDSSYVNLAHVYLYCTNGNRSQDVYDKISLESTKKLSSRNLNKYKNALANPQGNEWTPIESFMKSTFIPNYKLQQILDESIIITKEDIEKEFIKKNQLYTIDGLHVTSAKIPNEDSEPSYEDLKAKYESTKSDYEHGELRNISFVSWKKTSSGDDSLSIEKIAKNLYNRAKSGEDFASLANEYSVDPGNEGSKGGDLGWFTRGRMVKQFEEAAFNGVKGEIIKPIESRHGYHIIYVRDKKTENGQEQVLASHILLKIEISPTTLANIKRDATLFSYDAQDNGFASAVSDHKLNSNTHEKLNESSFSIKGVGGLRSAVRFSFDGKIGDVSDIMENDQYFAVFTINQIFEPGIKPIEDVEKLLTDQLKQEKIMALTLEKARKLMIDIATDDKSLINISKEDSDLDFLKNEQKTLSQGFTSIGKSNYLVGALLTAKPGEVIGPITTNRGHAIVELKAVSNFDSSEFEITKESLYRTIFNRKQNQYFNVWLDNLKESSEIIDNRKYYF